jgi:hypothetical protein
MIARTVALLLLLTATLATAPVRADETVFPIGSRVGLVPPPGFVPSKRLPGFETTDSQSSIVLVGLPLQAFPQIEATMTPEAVKGQLSEDTREVVAIPNGKGLLVAGREEENGQKFRKWMFLGLLPEGTVVAAVRVPEEDRKTYSDDVVRASLLTLAVRPMVPVSEVLELLPFKLNDLAGMRPVRAMPANGVFLTDGPNDSPQPSEQPVFVVSIGQGGPEQASERANFARNMFSGLTEFKDVRVISGDMLRLGNVPTHELQVEAKDAHTDTPMKIVQWVRFAPGGYIRMVGVAPADRWRTAFPRFRTVRDGIAIRE